MLLHRDECPRSERSRRGLAGRQLDTPVCAEPARRKCEDYRLRMCVEDEEERVAEDRLSVRRPFPDLPAVEEDAEGARLRTVPVPLCHPPPVGPEPPCVRQRTVGRAAGQERRPPEGG